jgi:hypothetical protein
MDERTRSFLDLPRWVADRNDERAGFIHLAADGLWRANNWSGSLGAFTTADEAEAAIRAAPAKPKVKKAPEPSPPIRLRFESLTAIEAGYQVFVLIPEEAAPQFRDDVAPRNGMMPPPDSEMIAPPITE